MVKIDYMQYFQEVQVKIWTHN